MQKYGMEFGWLDENRMIQGWKRKDNSMMYASIFVGMLVGIAIILLIG